MEAAFVLFPIGLALLTSLSSLCCYIRLNHRIVYLERSLNSQRNEQLIHYTSPPPSAPPAYSPGYGYQHPPGDPVVV